MLTGAVVLFILLVFVGLSESPLLPPLLLLLPLSLVFVLSLLQHIEFDAAPSALFVHVSGTRISVRLTPFWIDAAAVSFCGDILRWLRWSELFVVLVVVSVVRGLLCAVNANDVEDNDGGNAIECTAEWLDVSGITKSSLTSRLLTPPPPPLVDNSVGGESWLLLKIVSNIRPTSEDWNSPMKMRWKREIRVDSVKN